MSGPSRHWLEQLGDRINPILVKETRQALKSRQFMVTFLLLLAVSLVVSFAGIAIAGPNIDYQSTGGGFFVGYFTVLAFAIFVVVPFGAYRSLAVEQEERTFELLSITTLRPGQIVSGKLLSAVIQMFIYYSAIAPFMAFTYLLRGIDLLTISLVLGLSLLGSLGLSMIALVVATFSRRRSWHVFLSVLIIAALLFAGGLAIGLATVMVFENVGAEAADPWFWVGVAIFLTGYATTFAVAFQLAVSQLTFEADNRSTRVRVAIIVQFLAFVAWAGWGWSHDDLRGVAEYLSVMVVLAGVYWFVIGAFLASEPAGLSPRVARQVPRNPLARAATTVFFPGPGTGLALLAACLLCLVALTALAELIHDLLPPPPFGTRGLNYPTAFAAATAGYVFFYVGLGALVIRSVARFRRLPAIAAAAIILLVVAVGSLVPIFFAAIIPGHRFRDYRIWQITDPIFTLAEVYNMPFLGTLAFLPVGMGVLMLLVNLRTMAQAVSEVHRAGQRIAAPAGEVEPERLTADEPVPTAEPAAGV